MSESKINPELAFLMVRHKRMKPSVLVHVVCNDVKDFDDTEGMGTWETLKARLSPNLVTLLTPILRDPPLFARNTIHCGPSVEIMGQLVVLPEVLSITYIGAKSLRVKRANVFVCRLIRHISSPFP